MEVPSEIIHLVVNHAGDADDMPTLRSCNATSRQFRLIAQKRLFNYINIVINPEPDEMGRLEHLREIFTKSPSAGHLVKQLVLGFQGGNGGADSTCQLVLEMMPHVEQLTLESVETWGGRMWMQVPTWTVLAPSLQKAIGALLRLDSLFRVKVHEIMYFPVNILGTCRKGLRSLDLNLINPEDQEEFPQNRESLFDGDEETSLTACKLIGARGRDFNIIARAVPQCALRSLKTLQLGSNEHHEGLDMSTVQKLLDGSTPSLEAFCFMASVVNNTGSLNLSRATNLVGLRLGPQGIPADTIPWLLRVLETLPRSCRLQTLLLQLALDDSAVGELALLNAELIAPGKYDSCLIELHTFSFESDISTILITHMKELVRRPNVTIYDRSAQLDLEALRIRIPSDLV